MTYDSMELAPARDIPAEYTLRQFEPDDATAYLELFSLAWPDRPDRSFADVGATIGLYALDHPCERATNQAGTAERYSSIRRI